MNKRWWQELTSVWNIVKAMYCEIFDESAYDRFLALTKSPRSRESYRAFLKEREIATARKPRCC